MKPAALLRALLFAVLAAYLGYAGREAFAGPDDLARHGLIALALIAATLFLARRLRASPGFALLDIEALRQRIERREALHVVDVRGEEEYRGNLGHIPASLNIPLTELAVRLAELEALKDQPLVLVCRTDKRSVRAAALLVAAGFGHVEVLRGGMEQWNSGLASTENQSGKDAVHS